MRSNSFCLLRVLIRYFAKLALQSQRTAAGFLAAADRMAVIADAVGQQEVRVRILQRKSLRGRTILGDVAARQTRQQIRRRGGQVRSSSGAHR